MRLTLHRTLLAAAALTLTPPVEAQGGDPFPNLIESLRAIEGVLGVSTARTDDGKNVVFAWFADKAAVLRWFYSPYHRAMQDQFFPDRPPRTPLEHIADGTGPILAVASVTFGPNNEFRQIAIELYQPLPGGLAIGGTFAPEGMTIPHILRVGPDGLRATRPGGQN